MEILGQMAMTSQRVKLMMLIFITLITLLITIGRVQSSIFGTSNDNTDKNSSQNNNDNNNLNKEERISIRMPDIRPDYAEQYLCMTHRVKPDPKGQFIVGFNPVSDASRVHHMLMYGCEMPGIYQRDSPNFVWDCSEMHSSSNDHDRGVSFEQGPICQGQSQTLYGWALDAPALKLPNDVGFKIGGDSKINFLVLQVHYGHYHAFAQLPELTDNSGLVLDVKPNAAESGITRRAGVLLLISMGQVLEGRSKHEIWCKIEDEIEIHPFRFRVHTHKLGTKVTGAKIGMRQRNDFGYDFNEDSVIGVGDPQAPQMFYPVRDNNLTLTRGDSVYGSCEFNNNRGHVVNIGQTGDDEMCNFYMMYWTESPNLLSNERCFAQNPEPTFYDLLSSLV